MVTGIVKKTFDGLAAGAASFFIRAYQLLVSPIFPRSCRFYPTCSDYMLEALRVHGFFRGLSLGSRRVAKCQPFHPGGYDPVPPAGYDPVPAAGLNIESKRVENE